MKVPFRIFRSSLALCMLGGAAFPAGAAEYALYLGHVSVQFAVSHLDISYVRGRFDKISVTIDFDPAAKAGKVLVVVDPDSIDTGNRQIDNVLRTDQFLDTAAFTEIRFASERFVFEGDALVAVDGRLWLHGVDRPLRLDADRFVCKDVALGLAKKPVCGGVFHAALKRTDFGMTRFIPDVGDEVRLDIGVEASPR
jgi:polyisoprenoid-binding protein YceI